MFGYLTTQIGGFLFCSFLLYIHIMNVMTFQVQNDLAKHKTDTVRFVAAKLYESGKLSFGQAAEMAGLGKADNAEILSHYGVSFINYSLEDILQDVARIS